MISSAHSNSYDKVKASIYLISIERELEVNRSNKKLLEKLVEISKGKHVRAAYS